MLDLFSFIIVVNMVVIDNFVLIFMCNLYLVLVEIPLLDHLF
jgi:hypothetical protein